LVISILAVKVIIGICDKEERATIKIKISKTYSCVLLSKLKENKYFWDKNIANVKNKNKPVETIFIIVKVELHFPRSSPAEISFIWATSKPGSEINLNVEAKDRPKARIPTTLGPPTLATIIPEIIAIIWRKT